MLTEAINELLAGDIDLGKAILRDYINATIIYLKINALRYFRVPKYLNLPYLEVKQSKSGTILVHSTGASQRETNIA